MNDANINILMRKPTKFWMLKVVFYYGKTKINIGIVKYIGKYFSDFGLDDAGYVFETTTGINIFHVSVTQLRDVDLVPITE